MNRKILQKCIDELNKKNGKIDVSYLRGMLETLADLEPEVQKASMFLPTAVQYHKAVSDILEAPAQDEIDLSSISAPTGGMSAEEREIVNAIKGKK